MNTSRVTVLSQKLDQCVSAGIFTLAQALAIQHCTLAMRVVAVPDQHIDAMCSLIARVPK